MGKSPAWRFDKYGQREKTVLGIAALVLLVLVVYLPVIHCGYVWDDDDSVTQNPNLSSLRGLWRIWTNLYANQQYYPLTYTSFWIEYHLWELRPLGYHLNNVLLHAISAVLLWLILRRLSIPGAWLAAAIFAVHPLQAETVAWVTQRRSALSGVFYFAAMLAYLRYAGIGEGRRNQYPLALGLFACALLSKTATGTLPVALLLILWWKHKRLSSRHVLDLLPFFALAFVMGQITAWLEKHHAMAMGDAWNLSFAGKLIVAGKALAFYADKLVWPVGLIHVYPRWQIDPGDYRLYAFPLIAAAVPIGLWLLRDRLGKSPLVAVLYFEATLLPALGFFNVYFMKYSYVQNHFQYLAGAGLIALGAGVLTIAIRKARGLNLAVPAMVLLVLCILTWRQVTIFTDEETLWRDTIAKNPAAWMGYNNLGVLLNDEGRYDEAIAEYEKALELEPEFQDAYVNMGIALAAKGEMDRAIASCRRAIELSPRNANAHYCLARLLVDQGYCDEAIAHYETALEIAPGMQKARAGLELAIEIKSETQGGQ